MIFVLFLNLKKKNMKKKIMDTVALPTYGAMALQSSINEEMDTKNTTM